jgi:outer membrane protein assembly factor BamB
MHAEQTSASPGKQAEQVSQMAVALPRLWLPVALVMLYWLLHFIVAGLDKPYFVGFLYNLAAPSLLGLIYFGWWWVHRRIRLAERLYGFVLIVGVGVAMGPLVDKSVGWFGLLMNGLPLALTAWTIWLLILKRWPVPRRQLVAPVIVALAWGSMALVRIDGLNADLQADLRWRWSPSAEDLFLADRAQASPDDDSRRTALAAWTPVLSPGDWTGFRGPGRDGVVRGVRIATDWKQNPPRLWRKRVGPAWSSVIVVGDRLFTQEQRGQQEAVVCYDAAKGRELWTHEDSARFWETVSGAGPRATPAFADGRIFSLGGTGILNCLDAATGQRHWSRDIKADANAAIPMWGFSGSPLVVGRLVVVFAGGDGGKNLLAYRVESGELAWTAAAGPGSYSSPHLAKVAGKPQILMLSEQGLTAVDPRDGSSLWTTGSPMPGAPRTLQPQALDETRLVVGTLAGPGVSLIDVTQVGGEWKAVQRWASTAMKPEFPDFVVHQGHIYGFDSGIFCCIDLETGKRCWKGGRYGRGQVVLLAEPGLLLVLTESGEAVLLAANRARHEELGRFQALDGKTWNHPVIAHGRLYVRNAEEMACYELGAEGERLKAE